MPKGDSCFSKIIRGHLDVDLVPDTDADEVFAHFSGNMSEHLVTIGQGHSEHGTRQDLRHRPHQFNWFFFHHVEFVSRWPDASLQQNQPCQNLKLLARYGRLGGSPEKIKPFAALLSSLPALLQPKAMPGPAWQAVAPRLAVGCRWWHRSFADVPAGEGSIPYWLLLSATLQLF